MVRGVEGTHRGTASQWIFVVIPLVGVVGASALGLGWITRLVALGGLWVLAVAVTWVRAPRTQVWARGLRVRDSRGDVELRWEEIQEVVSSGRWEMGQDTRVMLQNDTFVELPGLPSERWSQELEAYWHAHAPSLPAHRHGPATNRKRDDRQDLT